MSLGTNADSISENSPTTYDFSHLKEGMSFEHYQLQKKIGAGGMGIVFLAEDTKINRQVAIKFILQHSNNNPRKIKRFLQEIQATAHLSHPGIIQMFHSGSFQGIPYMVMEFVAGKDFKEYLVERNLSLEDRVTIIAKVARTLSYTHKNQTIHRDIKPSNVLIRENLEPVLMDFGVAKVTQTGAKSLTRTGEIVGTLQYMSPEQLEGGKFRASPSMDIYSLGIMLYEVITGTLPVSGSSMMEMMHKVLYSEPIPPRELNSEISPTLEKICLKAIEKDPQDRYQNAEKFAKDLELFLAKQDDYIQTSFLSSRKRRWRTRFRQYKSNRSIILVGLVMVVLTAIVAGLWQQEAPTKVKTEHKKNTLSKLIKKYKKNPSLVLEKKIIQLQQEKLDNILTEAATKSNLQDKLDLLHRFSEQEAFEFPPLAVEKAKVFFELNQYLSALEQIEQAISYDDNNWSYQYLRAQCFEGLGELHQSFEILQGIERNQNKETATEVYQKLANIAFDLGNYPIALDYFQKIENRTNSELDSVYLRIIQCLWQIESQTQKEQISSYITKIQESSLGNEEKFSLKFYQAITKSPSDQKILQAVTRKQCLEQGLAWIELGKGWESRGKLETKRKSKALAQKNKHKL